MAKAHLKLRESASELKSWKSSYLFSQETQDRIRKLLDEAILEMDILNQEISGASTEQKGLERRRRGDIKRVSILRSAISDVKKLPSEILEKVFYLLHGSGAVLLPPSKSRHFSPWSLGHICSRWRSILWASPLIWGQITIQVYNGLGINLHSNYHTRDVVKHVLLKTTMTISLIFGELETQAIFDIILVNSRRFRSLTLHSLHTDMFAVLLRQPSDAWESLEFLDIQLKTTGDINLNNTTSSFQTAPNLRSVAFLSSSTEYVPQLLLLPFAQLVDLSISFVELPVAAVYATLEQCLHLTLARMSARCDNTFDAHRTMTLHHLQKFNLTTTYEDFFDWDRFLQPFITPSLSSLILNSQRVPIPGVASLLLRSACSLINFAVETWSPYERNEDIESLLGLLPNIKRLVVSWVVPSSYHSENLCPTGSATPPPEARKLEGRSDWLP
ncbi:hypothetical protein BDZ94DRAFT_1310604 [Collybia nuda]|uniref:F-box domain-containing protein n=1 Tax=Collybia nuda TaxID=64659 RepID=A0A9P5Y381_9AGAR|nr:hypothetical protein BDZ94DRAFT_1310604 [Collybia nuda]